MGFGAVVVLTTILKYAWNAEADTRLFADLSKVNGGLLFLFSAIRLVDIGVQGKFHHLLDGGHKPFFFVLEMVLFLVPAFMFFSPKVQKNRGKLFRAALMAVAAGALWRVDAYLTAFDAGTGWEYMPSLGETAVTVGMAAVGMAVFIAVCRLFPVVVITSRPHTSNVRATGTASGR
jgi:Ni/Fe-hydrogenase subunit HybB-like protein